MRPRLLPSAYLRSYVGDFGRAWILVREPGQPRLRLDARTRAVVEMCDGTRSLALIARQEPAAEALLAPLVADGTIVDDAAPSAATAPRGGLEMIELAPDAALRLVIAPGGIDCDGRGGCCRLYDRIGLADDDVGRIASCFGDERTPGGLYMPSVIVHDRPDDEHFALAVVDGGCSLLEPDGRCGVHARAGAAHKPIACHFYPVRDVVCGDELHVALGVECRCVIDFAGAPPDSLRALAEELRARRLREGVAEAVAAEVPLAVARRVPRLEYLRWRAAAGERLGDDAVAWALGEAAALVGGAPRSLDDVLADEPALVPALARWLAFEADDTAANYSRVDLQRALFAWGAAAAKQLRAPFPSTPVTGERMLARQLLHGHGLLRSATVVEGLLSLALRVALARVGAALPLLPELLPITAAEYLARTFSFGRIFDGANTIEASLTTVA
jgi:hypothetical protein